MTIIRKYGRTIIAVLILILSAIFGEADLTELEGFLTNIVENGAVSIAAIAGLVAHYFGERQLELFESKEEAETRKQDGPAPPSSCAIMVAILAFTSGMAFHRVASSYLKGPEETGARVTEVAPAYLVTSTDEPLLKHRCQYEPAGA